MRALVTGATGNVGRKATVYLLENDWNVVSVSRSITIPVPDEWKEQYRKLETYRVGLTVGIDITRFLSTQEPFDLVIMAHGIQAPAELGTANFIDTYHSVIDGNLTSAVYLTQALIEQDKLNEGALIVYCSSIQATQTRRGRGCYGIAKAGLEALARIVTVEQAPLGIRAIALRLGQLESEGQPATMAGIKFSPGQLEAMKARCPLPWVKVENVAKLCLSLYEQTEISGAVLDVDSGHSLNIWP